MKYPLICWLKLPEPNRIFGSDRHGATVEGEIIENRFFRELILRFFMSLLSLYNKYYCRLKNVLLAVKITN